MVNHQISVLFRKVNQSIKEDGFSNTVNKSLTILDKKTIKLHKRNKRAKKFFEKANRRKKFVLNTPQQVIKIAWGESAKLLTNREFIADQQINSSSSNIWHNHATFYRKRLKVGGIIVASSPRLVRQASEAEIDEFAKHLLERIPSNISYQHWDKTLEQNSLSRMYEVMTKEQQDFINSTLQGVKLPITSAHGDLIDKNIWIDQNGKIKLIDWEYYREQGSVITDLLRLYSFRFKAKMKQSQFSPTLIKDINLPISFQKYMDIPISKLSLLAAITNVCLPVPWSSPEKRSLQLAQKLSNFYD